MADNLLHPLAYVSALLMLIGSAWTGSLLAAIVPLAYIALPVLLNLANADSWRLKGLLVEICLLPVNAWTALAAIVRALYRTYVSREHMLDWTTADDADRSGRVSRVPGVAAAILLLPVLAHPMLWPAMLALSGLFLLGADWLNLQQQSRREKPLSEVDRSFLLELAKRTWRFFADNVNDQTNHLPPDNVQLNPPIGAAKRTSPTNIGMYLLSCLCAGHLGLIEREEVESRIGRTLDTLERMPKWRGHLYNWHDITDLKPLPPVMASSVDSGNLVGCLLCLAASDLPVSLRKRARNLAENTQLAALYDPERELFHVSADAAGDGLSEAHYDLFASESRILSLSAIALGQVPAEHWRRLGRETVSLESGRAHISWSGTMFEYLMPDLLFTAPEQSAWSESARTVTDLQMEKAIDGMWGVSESGCAELDEEQQYGYRAFGLEEVSNSGRAQGGVIAPYAAALAMKYRREAAVETLRLMAERGYWTECGMIEAIDLRLGEPERIDSHMAHHQGMLLCALTNALRGDVLSKTMASLPEIRAISPLLQEKWQ